MSTQYHNQLQAELDQKIKNLLTTLPDCCYDYYQYMLYRNRSIRTCYTYMYSFKIFFYYLVQHEVFEDESLNLIGREPNTITNDELEKITENDIYDFMIFLTSYDRNVLFPDEAVDNKPDIVTNSPKGKNGKLSALKSLYKYMQKTHKIRINALANVDFTDIPKSKKTPVHLEIDETVKLLDIAENYTRNTNESTQFLAANNKLKYRDLAILMLLCDTGIRVSELVGLNIEDINYKKNSLSVLRKGGYEQDVFMNDETMAALKDYINYERSRLMKIYEPNALFYSLQKKRITVRAVENIVNKYSVLIPGCDKGNGKSKITPHRLRSTYAVLFLTNGIGTLDELAENMGHSNTAITKVYAGSTRDEIRQRAAAAFKLREE